ncbi:MAG: right-handed parallel beta-helix repeat-containing protein [Lewinellaceae bacterium]|nr:right-handed parallel beta-helix repeat-containing protein [Lewinellaceae bacterium]
MKKIVLLFLLLLAAGLHAQTPEVELKPGLKITRSCRIKPGAVRLEAPTEIQTGAGYAGLIVIVGNNLVVDFQNAALHSTADPTRPDLFTGLAILVQGQNITIQNARVHGFKIGLLAYGTAELTLENCDFSYNYRPRLRSIREREDFSDWLSYHQNDRNEWLRYGAGIYLDSCSGATVRDCRITGNQNALLMTRSNDGLFYNNTFQFNSGLGIGLYRSSRNRVMHNRLDWNVRGYSHGFYQRGQDSAALLCYEQSNENIFAFNSATHSGDGFFLWAGKTTMDTGAGGCNDNIIFGNDFSYAPTNGVEVTFSRNRIQGNLIRECTYGIWGGYSYESVFMGNYIANCRTGIAIEHGQDNTIRQNYLESDSIGVHLWARAEQPADWGYAQKRDTRSRDALIDRNVFLRVKNPLKLAASRNIAVNGENLFSGYQTLLETPRPNDSLKFLRNDLYGSMPQIERVWAHPELAPARKLNSSYPDRQPPNPFAPLAIPFSELAEPDSLPDGVNTQLASNQPVGRENILVDEWGPFDFRRPQAFLTNIADAANGEIYYSLQLHGPPGQWRIVRQHGVVPYDQSSGAMPGLVLMRCTPDVDDIRVEFEYIGKQDFTDGFGRTVPAGQPYRFAFQRFEKSLNWTVQFFNLTNELAKTVQAWAQTPLSLGEEPGGQKPVAEKTVRDLYFAWWGSPAEGVQADNFATISTTTFDIAPGRYAIELTSDDGARLYIDGKRVIDHWDIHEPAVDEIEVELGGTHTIRIEHFEASGFGTLGFRMRVVW